MGVEYRHALYVVDRAWKPTWEHVKAIHAVLETWNLATEPLTPPDDASYTLRVDFGQATGSAVTAVLGPSQYGLGDDTRYVDVHLWLIGYAMLDDDDVDDDDDELDDEDERRSGLILDCGKDLPAIAEEASETPGEGSRPLPNREFVAALENAFGTTLVEQGWIY